MEWPIVLIEVRVIIVFFLTEWCLNVIDSCPESAVVETWPDQQKHVCTEYDILILISSYI